MSADRYQSWAEAHRLADEMHKATLDRLSRPKASPQRPPDRPRLEGIPYTPPTNKEID